MLCSKVGFGCLFGEYSGFKYFNCNALKLENERIKCAFSSKEVLLLDVAVIIAPMIIKRKLNQKILFSHFRFVFIVIVS